MKTATHKRYADVVVKFSTVKDFLGNAKVKVVFSDGSSTTMSLQQFEETFTVN